MRTEPTSTPNRLRRGALAALAAWASVTLVNRSLVRVNGSSMEPTLWPDEILVTWPRTGIPLRVGWVVVVDDPSRPGYQVVKRIHAVGPAGIDVRGDAPDRSTDSRMWGPLPRRAVRRIVLRRWPDVLTPLTREPAAMRDQVLEP